jgi:hypothetical protein
MVSSSLGGTSITFCSFFPTPAMRYSHSMLSHVERGGCFGRNHECNTIICTSELLQELSSSNPVSIAYEFEAHHIVAILSPRHHGSLHPYTPEAIYKCTSSASQQESQPRGVSGHCLGNIMAAGTRGGE